MESLGTDINWNDIGSSTVKELNYVIQQKQIKIDGKPTKGNLVKALTEYRDNVIKSASASPVVKPQAASPRSPPKEETNESKPPASPRSKGRGRKTKGDETPQRTEEPAREPSPKAASPEAPITPVNVVHESPRVPTPPRQVSPSIAERTALPISSKKAKFELASISKTALCILPILIILVLLYFLGAEQ
ncbi:hypothetical protein TVAG_180590 [Trichomonas vaginalis G3]|uniref:Uncharacterized protein n=1 Tax=Trichomonas vaginalis (strain ATCC PRA-98 / G3) TaxID=412133 RepID=A2EE87_TRIV3|nr:hypothetical protein TVAGG3_0614020 [Trichomonas vaginalis G3]EAY09084.1 hypothetical protein TVAG_180590 [Trichomonas vaginalis G3]KAI5503401.1 hypothetical protein TVAGG3_0614020 [Trichomonas vaginalis G3]|eukprot:XP_001321307.1 hypothetical protein [Trichomonas vaginalis G3]